MKFNKIRFTHTGCCGAHNWAEVSHQNGLRTEIHNCNKLIGSSFEVTTWAGRNVLIGSKRLTGEAAVEARLISDAKLSA